MKKPTKGIDFKYPAKKSKRTLSRPPRRGRHNKTRRASKSKSSFVEQPDIFTTAALAETAKASGIKLPVWAEAFIKNMRFYTPEHGVEHAKQEDIVEELSEENTFNEVIMKKLASQLPENLIDPGKKFWVDRIGIVAAPALTFAAFTATFFTTAHYIEENSPTGSMAAAYGMAGIATMGAGILKWGLSDPLVNFKRPIEILMVPVGIISFGLYIGCLTDTFFFIAPEESATVAFDLDELMSAGSSSGEEEKTISMKTVYTAGLISETVFSYGMLSWFIKSALPSINPEVKAILSEMKKNRGPMKSTRKKFRNAKGVVRGLGAIRKMTSAPAEAFKTIIKKLSK